MLSQHARKRVDAKPHALSARQVEMPAYMLAHYLHAAAPRRRTISRARDAAEYAMGRCRRRRRCCSIISFISAHWRHIAILLSSGLRRFTRAMHISASSSVHHLITTLLAGAALPARRNRPLAIFRWYRRDFAANISISCRGGCHFIFARFSGGRRCCGIGQYYTWAGAT